MEKNSNVTNVGGYDSTADSLTHIRRVNGLLIDCVKNLLDRAAKHDESKLHSPEKEGIDACIPKLRHSIYGSQEYFETLKEMRLDHHYANNSHHPEYFRDRDIIAEDHPELCRLLYRSDFIVDKLKEHGTEDDVKDMKKIISFIESEIDNRISNVTHMSLFDIMEMLVDHKAASERHITGDMASSLKINKGRFKFSTQLYCIFLNTCVELGFIEPFDKMVKRPNVENTYGHGQLSSGSESLMVTSQLPTDFDSVVEKGNTQFSSDFQKKLNESEYNRWFNALDNAQRGVNVVTKKPDENSIGNTTNAIRKLLSTGLPGIGGSISQLRVNESDLKPE